MKEEFEALKAVTGRLEHVKIPYMLTGSMAANFYVVPRMTRDIDIVIRLAEQDAEKILAVFKDDFYIDRGMVAEAIRRKGMFNIIHNKTMVKADLILCNETPYQRIEFERRRQIQVDNIKLWMISIEDLILSKLLWAKDSLSEVQLRDVKNLLDFSKGVDKGYLRRWLKPLGLEKLYEKAKRYE